MTLLLDKESFLNQADGIRRDLAAMADPDALECIEALSDVFREESADVRDLFNPDFADEVLFEFSKLRDFIGIDRRKKKASFSGRPVMTR